MLLNNDLQVIKYEIVVFQGEIHAKELQIEICENTTNNIRKNYVDHAKNPGLKKVLIIVQSYIER